MSMKRVYPNTAYSKKMNSGTLLIEGLAVKLEMFRLKKNDVIATKKRHSAALKKQ